MNRLYNITTDVSIVLFIILLFVFSQNTMAQEEFVEDELIVKVATDRNSTNATTILANTGEVIKSIPELGVHVLRVNSANIEGVKTLLTSDANFEYVERNYLVYATAIPNDEFYSFQDYLDLINAPAAWDSEIGDPNVTIAVLDTGVDATHEDLNGKVLQGCSTLGTFSETNCGTNTSDIDGHGSGVSGTAAANTNNSIGVAGVCQGCQILPVKVLNDFGTGTVVDTVEGILFARNYALNNTDKKVIINMSLGRDCNVSGVSQIEQDAINLAWNSGLLIVAAAGNEGNSNLHCPAAADNTIAVSNTDINDNLASTSSFGDFVDLAAPGVNIGNVLSSLTQPPILYVFWSGTSFSSPVVAGIAGLIWSANMSLTNTNVDQILRDTAVNIGSSFFFGDGRVNAQDAVIEATTAPPTPTPTPTPQPSPTPPPVTNESLLSGLDPNISGQNNMIMVIAAPPGSTVNFNYSFNTGVSIISGSGCDGQQLGLNNAINFASVVSDNDGTAVFNVFVPSGVSGATIHFQAYSETGALCDISDVVTQVIDSTPPPTPTPEPTPPPVDPTLEGLNPNIEGLNNTITVSDALPGSTVYFYYSLNTGSTTIISDEGCEEEILGLNNAIELGSVVADANGNAVFNVFVPVGFAGITVHLQAFAETPSYCGITNLTTQTIQ